MSRVRCRCGRYAAYDAYYARWWCERCEQSIAPPKVEPTNQKATPIGRLLTKT